MKNRKYIQKLTHLLERILFFPRNKYLNQHKGVGGERDQLSERPVFSELLLLVSPQSSCPAPHQKINKYRERDGS